jgi:hypothetical protein
MKKNRKCKTYGCTNYANTLGKKYGGFCTYHYSKYIDKKSNEFWIFIFLAVIVLSVLLK